VDPRVRGDKVLSINNYFTGEYTVFLTFLKNQISKVVSLYRMLVQALFVILLSIADAYATSTGLPWESPLQKILDSLTGPVAKVLGVVAIVLAGFGIAFGEAGSGMRRIFQIVLGLSIAFTASSLVVSLFGFSGGVSF
jgi:type IV secretion system protein TrbC